MKKWRDVVGLEGRYAVSDDGQIKSLATGKLRRSHPMNKGYLTLQLPGPLPRGFCTRTVHSVVAEAFLGSRPAGAQVNHKNGRKTDNRAANLEWVTGAQNMRHAIASGLFQPFGIGGGGGHPQSGELNENAKLTEADAVKIISLLTEGNTGRSLAKRFGVSKALISAIKSGQRWGHLPRQAAGGT